MDRTDIMAKAERGEEMTVEEIIEFQKAVKPQEQTYGKYGTLAKIYLEEHNVAKLWALGGDLPKYLHGIDSQAEELYDAMYARLSKSERFKKTGDFLKDVQLETEMKHIIEEEILNELVYVK